MVRVDTFGAGPSISLIHGWGAQNTVWKDWAQSNLAPHFKVSLIELPGFGESPKIENKKNNAELADAWTQAIIEALPKKTHLLGWSLGGLVAQNIALKHPEKIESLICLATTPRFTQTDNWSGAVSPKLMADFMQSIQADSLATLKSFWTLQLQGSDLPRKSVRSFIQRMQDSKLPTLTGLTQGLKLLNHFDFRQRAQHFETPVLWLLGENDPLIPTQTIENFHHNAVNSKQHIIHGAAHTPFVSHPDETAHAIIEFTQTLKH